MIVIVIHLYFYVSLIFNKQGIGYCYNKWVDLKKFPVETAESLFKAIDLPTEAEIPAMLQFARWELFRTRRF